MNPVLQTNTDARTLKAAEPLTIAAPGLKGVIVADTELGAVRGDEGFFHYRDRNATDLARDHSLEAIWAFLLDGTEPDEANSADTADELRTTIGARRVLSATVNEQLPRVAASVSSLSNGLISIIPWLLADAEPTLDLTHDQRRDQVLTVAAAVPSVLAGLHRCRLGLPVIPADPAAGHAHDWLSMTTGTEPNPTAVHAVQTYLNATIDHGFNASTFATRVVTSTGADVAAALCAGVGALSGPLHGGAPSRALAMVNDIGDPANTERWLDDQLASGNKIMGFGHAVYRAGDPRSELLREVAMTFDDELVDRAVEIERRILAHLCSWKPNAVIVTNVEFYAGIALHLAGVPAALFTPSFTVARAIGWSAQLLEQAANNKIMRPSANYVGPEPRR